MRQVKYKEHMDIRIDKLYEDFLQKDLAKVVEKMISLISKKVGMKFVGGIESRVGEGFSSPSLGGKFIGFNVYIVGGGKVRINFSLTGKSGKVHSISYWESDGKTIPTKNIVLPPQFNIVQIMDHIIEALTGNYANLGEEKIGDRILLQERESHKERLAQWMQENPRVQDEIARRGTDWESLLDNYIRFLSDVGARLSEPSRSSFQVTCKKVLDSLGNEQASNNVPHVNVIRGTSESYVELNTDSEMTYEEELMQNEHITAFEMMERMFNEIAQGTGDYTGIYIYGRGGIGKSHAAKKILVPLPNAYYTKGKIKGYEGLLNLLYKHRDGEILILDDILTDDDMKSTTIQNILKAVLEPGTNRMVKVEIPERMERGTEVGSEIQAPEVGESDVIDFTSDAGIAGGESIYDFKFNSIVIVITNYKKIPQPLQDRCYAIAMLFSDDQVVELIRRVLDKCSPKHIDVEIKEFALNWLKDRYKGRVRLQEISFRLFSRVVITYVQLRDDPDPKRWEREAFALVRQQGINI